MNNYSSLNFKECSYSLGGWPGLTRPPRSSWGEHPDLPRPLPFCPVWGRGTGNWVRGGGARPLSTILGCCCSPPSSPGHRSPPLCSAGSQSAEFCGETEAIFGFWRGCGNHGGLCGCDVRKRSGCTEGEPKAAERFCQKETTAVTKAVAVPFHFPPQKKKAGRGEEQLGEPFVLPRVHPGVPSGAVHPWGAAGQPQAGSSVINN